MGTVPIGAPVRINIILRNESEAPVVALATLSIETGMVSGAVIDPSAPCETFSHLFLCVDERRWRHQGYEMRRGLFSDFFHKHFVIYSQSVPKEHRALLNA